MLAALPSLLGIGHNDCRRLVGPGALGNGLAYARAGTATRFDAAGVLAEIAADTARFSGGAERLLVEEARTNTLRNPRAEGAVAGSPGTVPTNWAPSLIAGVSRQIVAVGSEGGVPYLEVRLSGTPTATGNCIIYFEAINQVAAAVGQPWAFSSYLRLVGGSMANITPGLRITELDASLTVLSAVTVNIAAPTGAALGTQRPGMVRTLTGATVAFVRPAMIFAVASGLPVDATLRIGAPQLEAGGFATSTMLAPVGAPGTSLRAADQASWSPSGGFGSPGTLVVKAMLPQAASSAAWQGLWQLDDGSDANRIVLRNNAGGLTVSGLLDSGGSTLATLAAGSVTAGVPFRAAFAWSPGSQALCLSGGSVQTAAVAVPSGLTRLLVGHGAVGLNRALNGEIEILDWRPRRVADALLQSLANQS